MVAYLKFMILFCTFRESYIPHEVRNKLKSLMSFNFIFIQYRSF